MDFTLHVPVPTFVYKYISKIFRDPKKEFYDWRLSTHLKEGKFVYALLERSLCRYEKMKPNEIILPITIPHDMATRKGVFIPQESVDLFIGFIKQVIMDEVVLFHTGIKARQGLKEIDKVSINQYMADDKVRLLRINTKEAEKFFWQKAIVKDVLAKYDITEDEISAESVVKYLQRHSQFHYSAS
ncbi:hypothetical protein ACRQ5D_10800 [Mucilaginibacter sp. P25]|uniref:hypothetical protein n=1 Tax=Mucilaginibacter sp. P25 TaxID=3423945 RepID=UPI003D792E78